MEKKISTIKERLIYFIDNQKIKKERFFSGIDMTSANFRGVSLKSALNSTAIEKIISLYPQLNIYWLITGKGEMLSEPDQPTNSLIVSEPAEKYGGIDYRAELINAQRKIIELQDELARERGHNKKSNSA